jgi:S-adenosylmethionine hydrolase
MKASDVEKLGSGVMFAVAGREIAGLSAYYGEKPGLLALVGSSGYVEIALQNGSAAKALEVGRGTKVTATA